MGKNPFSSVVDKFNEARETADAVSKGDILMIGGSDGRPTNLYRSISNVNISLIGVDDDDDGISEVPFGNGDDGQSRHFNTVYVGEIPGLVALKGVGGSEGNSSSSN